VPTSDRRQCVLVSQPCRGAVVAALVASRRRARANLREERPRRERIASCTTKSSDRARHKVPHQRPRSDATPPLRSTRLMERAVRKRFRSGSATQEYCSLGSQTQHPIVCRGWTPSAKEDGAQVMSGRVRPRWHVTSFKNRRGGSDHDFLWRSSEDSGRREMRSSIVVTTNVARVRVHTSSARRSWSKR